MSKELLIKKVRVRLTFAIGWTFAGTYLFFYPINDQNWFTQNGWWLCFILGFFNLAQMNFLTRQVKNESKTDSD